MKAWILSAVAVGVLFLIAGGVFGWTSLSRDGVTCGSAFSPNAKAALVADYGNAMQADAEGVTLASSSLSSVSDNCASARSDRQPIAVTLLALGGVVILVSLVTGAAMAPSQQLSTIGRHEAS